MKSLLFPGQGAQFVGMGENLFIENDRAKALFLDANDILGYELSKIMFEASEEKLKETRITQPALFVHSMATLASLEEKPRVDFMAGHSLGECTALTAAGVLSFEDGLRLVDHRARAMQAACDDQPSTMAAIVGLEDEIVGEVCDSIDDIVVAANYNCPGQLVISGSISGIDTAVAILKNKGAKMAVVLKVAGAFHSPLMLSAQESFEHFIGPVNFKPPSCPIVQNVSAKAESDPEILKTNLVAQLTSPVRWAESMKYLIEQGVNEVVEVGGNGKVLRGLMRRIDRNVKATAI